MEEKSTLVKNEKLETVDILKKALVISAKNFNFLIFTTITSLPLFFFLVYYEIFIQKFLDEISEIAKPPPSFQYYSLWLNPIGPTIDGITDGLNKEFVDQLIQLCLLYLVPLHLLELGTLFVIVDMASKIYTEETPMMTFKEMVHRPFEKSRIIGTLVTSIYVLLLSTSTSLGLIWLVTNHFVILRNFMFDVFFAALCLPLFVALLGLHLALNAVWNVSLVISILDGIHGTDALAVAIYYSRGHEWRGLRLMLVFFAWGVSLRLPCLYFGCYETENRIFGITAQIGLFCLGNMLKWVVCLVYFFDCKYQALAKNKCVESVVNEEEHRKDLP